MLLQLIANQMAAYPLGSTATLKNGMMQAVPTFAARQMLLHLTANQMLLTHSPALQQPETKSRKPGPPDFAACQVLLQLQNALWRHVRVLLRAHNHRNIGAARPAAAERTQQ